MQGNIEAIRDFPHISWGRLCMPEPAKFKMETRRATAGGAMTSGAFPQPEQDGMDYTVFGLHVLSLDPTNQKPACQRHRQRSYDCSVSRSCEGKVRRNTDNDLTASGSISSGPPLRVDRKRGCRTDIFRVQR